jgi:hypothetical protein
LQHTQEARSQTTLGFEFSSRFENFLRALAS